MAVPLRNRNHNANNYSTDFTKFGVKGGTWPGKIPLYLDLSLSLSLSLSLCLSVCVRVCVCVCVCLWVVWWSCRAHVTSPVRSGTTEEAHGACNDYTSQLARREGRRPRERRSQLKPADTCWHWIFHAPISVCACVLSARAHRARMQCVNSCYDTEEEEDEEGEEIIQTERFISSEVITLSALWAGDG